MKTFLKLFVVVLILTASQTWASQAQIAVPNGTGAQVRTAVNNALQAITTHQSASTAPSPTFPFMLWSDTTSAPNGSVLKIRNSQNTAWLSLCTINDSTGSITFPYASSAGSAASATNATYASSAGSATSATSAGYATNAGHATIADTATVGTTVVANNASGTGNIPKAYSNGAKISWGRIRTQGVSNPDYYPSIGFDVTANRTAPGQYNLIFGSAFTHKPTVVVTTNSGTYRGVMADGWNQDYPGVMPLWIVNSAGTPTDTTGVIVSVIAIGD